jgi:hypothetical protein
MKRVLLGRRLQAALSNAHAANEMNKGKEPLSSKLHTAIYLLEACVDIAFPKPKPKVEKST